MSINTKTLRIYAHKFTLKSGANFPVTAMGNYVYAYAASGEFALSLGENGNAIPFHAGMRLSVSSELAFDQIQLSNPGTETVTGTLLIGFGNIADFGATSAAPAAQPSAKGDKGDKGDPGASAYEIAVDNGFEGTEAEWLASLTGTSIASGKITYVVNPDTDRFYAPSGGTYLVEGSREDDGHTFVLPKLSATPPGTCLDVNIYLKDFSEWNNHVWVAVHEDEVGEASILGCLTQYSYDGNRCADSWSDGWNLTVTGGNYAFIRLTGWHIAGQRCVWRINSGLSYSGQPSDD